MSNNRNQIIVYCLLKQEVRIYYETDDDSERWCEDSIVSFLKKLSQKANIYMDYYGMGRTMDNNSFVMKHCDNKNPWKKKYWVDSRAIEQVIKDLDQAMEDGRYIILYLCSEKIDWNMFCVLRPGDRRINLCNDNVLAILYYDGIELSLSVHTRFSHYVDELLNFYSERGFVVKTIPSIR